MTMGGIQIQHFFPRCINVDFLIESFDSDNEFEQKFVVHHVEYSYQEKLCSEVKLVKL